ncbi:MAG: hypothetical protein QHC40_10700 [Sphingobium sp.]|nr:hypothetical protein [Sphingobium sp.]
MTEEDKNVAASFLSASAVPETPFKDNDDLLDSDWGWSPARSPHWARLLERVRGDDREIRLKLASCRT